MKTWLSGVSKSSSGREAVKRVTFTRCTAMTDACGSVAWTDWGRDQQLDRHLALTEVAQLMPNFFLVLKKQAPTIELNARPCVD